MSTDQPSRERHPIQDHLQAVENYRTVCGVRGYCGPFLNEQFYNSFPDPVWHGYGECLVCCSTCFVAHEEMKRRTIESGRKSALVPPPLNGS